jgi:hypothetical protein
VGGGDTDPRPGQVYLLELGHPGGPLLRYAPAAVEGCWRLSG